MTDIAAAAEQGAARLKGDNTTTQELNLTKYIEHPDFADQVIAAHPRVFEMDEGARKQMARRFVALTRSELKRNPDLALKCTPTSALIAILDAAKMGLEPGPHKHVYLVPFKSNATLIIDARGWAAMGRRAGFKTPHAGPIYSNDNLSFQYGQDRHFTFTFDPFEDRGKLIGHYAYVEDADGEPYFEIVSLETIRKHEKASPSGSSGPWGTWPIEMGNKTALKILYRLLPLSAEIEYAMRVDETVADDDDPEKRTRGKTILDLTPEPTFTPGPPVEAQAAAQQAAVEQTATEAPAEPEAPKQRRVHRMNDIQRGDIEKSVAERPEHFTDIQDAVTAWCNAMNTEVITFGPGFLKRDASEILKWVKAKYPLVEKTPRGAAPDTPEPAEETREDYDFDGSVREPSPAEILTAKITERGGDIAQYEAYCREINLIPPDGTLADIDDPQIVAPLVAESIVKGFNAAWAGFLTWRGGNEPSDKE